MKQYVKRDGLSLSFTRLFKPGIAFLLFLIGWQPGLFAQTVRYVKPGGTGTGTSWTNASGDLQAMINASAANDQVWVAAGTCKPLPAQVFRMKDGVAIYGGFTGNENSLSTRNWQTNVTVLEGSGKEVIHNNSVSNTAILDGFTITGGIGAYGAGIINSSCSPTIRNCIITANAGSGMDNTQSSPIIHNCMFTGNTADQDGAAVHNSVDCAPVFTNCTFSGNTSTGSGGAVSSSLSSVVFVNCLFTGNKALLGGAIEHFKSTLKIINCTISGNQAAVSGGVLYETGGTIVITNSIISGNANRELGGSSAVNVTVSYCIVKGGFPGTGNIDADPLFVNPQPFANAPTTAGDYSLQAGSPAKNAGDNDSYEGADGNTGNSSLVNDKDLANNTRSIGASIDMGAFEIQRQSQTINTITGISKTYGDTDFEPGVTATSGLTVAFASADNSIAEAFLDVADGNKWKIKIKQAGAVKITASQPGNSNYDPAGDLEFMLTIGKKPVAVTADAKSIVYGDADPSLTYTSTSLAPGDGFSGALSRVSGNDVGTYAINQGTLALNSNYSLTYAGSNLTISPKAITVTADAKSKVYGDADPVLTYTVSPALVGSDVFTGTLSRAGGNDVGNYAINQGTLALNSNYSLTYAGSNLTISPKAIAVTADAKSKVYGDADPALTYTSTSLVPGDGFSGALSRAGGQDVGNYAINQGSLLLNSNYNLTYAGNNLVINKANLTVTATDKTICFDDAVGTIPVSYSDFKYSDNASSLSREPRVNIPSFSAAGNYPLAPSGGSSNNYTFNYVNGQLTVLPAPAGTIVQSPTAAGAASGFQLTAPTGTQYLWSTGEATAAITVKSSNSYSVKVTNQQGCSNNFTTQVKLETLSIPNTFSPNGDGINDYWVVPELSNYPNAYVIVVNRDGQTVFETKAFTRWDGKYSGNALPAGVYFYRIRKAPAATPVTGWLNLIK